ncbi:MAG TPA: NAD(P)-dependent alcohol dehydrogenase [Terracidiphilus sp.]|nr:NAD(P)-dependent alcohol dehydrogenase [Terracidiphilus sp.]
MKAIVRTTYGPAAVLRFEEIDKPVPAEKEVLIRVRAASVNPYDWHFMRGTPHFIRLFIGLRRPKSPRLGADVAGEIQSVGSRATQFKPGDVVFGTARGAFAEYACAPESTIALKPGNVTFEHAAAAPIAGFTALQGLRDTAHLQPGQRVLINGAAGGVGTFAVQIAKFFGAEVTGVCSTRNVEMVRSIGADHVIDYTEADFTRSGEQYDVLFDCVGHHSLSECRRVITPRGIYVGVGGGGPEVGSFALIAGMIKKPVLSLFVKQKLLGLHAKANREDLAILGDMINAGKITPVIDRRFRLTEVPDAIRYVETGHARGKVVIIPE